VSETASLKLRTSSIIEFRLLSIKVKVKLSLCFNWAPRHEGILMEWRYCSTNYLASALDGGEWSASRHGRFTPREIDPSTPWIRGWVGTRAVLDAVVKRKIPSPRRESNPRTPIVQPVAPRYTDWAITALLSINTELIWCFFPSGEVQVYLWMLQRGILYS
jgi:hypothetical protein